MPSVAQEAWALLKTTLEGYIEDDADLGELEAAMNELVPAEQCERIAALLNHTYPAYRDGVLIQTACKLIDPSVDATMRQKGARGLKGTAGRLGSLLAANHIRFVKDAYQNIGKNTANLVRGTVAAWDEFITWLNEATPEQLEAILEYACCYVASTSRPVESMPELNIGKLTFAAVMGLYERLLTTPSGGVHEQFIVASLLDALVQAHAPDKFWVDTKQVCVADRSSQAAGDVQIKTGSRVIEAYEVTAAGWETKLEGVGQVLREHDLPRMHVIAHVAEPYGGVVGKLLRMPDDVSVIDLRGFASVIVSGLTRQYRAHALRRMYDLLDRVQGDVDRVNAYVEAMLAEGLAVVP